MIADELRLAGLTVVEGRRGRGSHPIESVTVERTGTTADAASDVNELGLIDRAVVYVERTGRVWVLADRPIGSGLAVVMQAAEHDADLPGAQEDATQVVLALLAHETADLAGDGEIGADDEPVAVKRTRKSATKETTE